jgi:putative SOS response-associated peptidase YedK
VCGRFALHAPASSISEALSVLVPDDLLAGAGIPGGKARRSFNIAPTDAVLGVGATAAGRVASWVRWGLLPPRPTTAAGLKGRPLINARSDSLATNGLFKHALRGSRMIVPASGFYEWLVRDGAKVPFYLRPRAGGILAFAALRSVTLVDGDPLSSCALITTDANALMRPVHDRMPVILDRAAVDAWLDPDQTDVDALVALCRPCDDALLEPVEVSQRVNQVRNDDVGLITPIA